MSAREPFLTFFVEGLPETKGSWIPLGGGRLKRDNPREKAWAEHVAWIAKVAMRGRLPLGGGALVALDFMLPAPVGRKHQRDIDKLARSALDAMTGLVYSDDEVVRDLIAHKEVTVGAPRLEVRVYEPLGVRASDLVQFWLDQHDALRRLETRSDR